MSGKKKLLLYKMWVILGCCVVLIEVLYLGSVGTATVERFSSVSYTHLDVYKRQPEHP